MRGNISSYLEVALVLLLVPAVSAQNVTIDLTPISYPIQLPDSGGSFDYLLTVTNQGSMPITATVWCMVTLPNGSSWGPVVGPATQTLGAGQTQSHYKTQNVPPRAPYGYFTLHAYVGLYPDTVWAQDEFEFQHQAVSGTEQEWVARYDGPGADYDAAQSLVEDETGDVYVTGYSIGSGNDYDYATVKYNSSGVEQWVARYNGTGNDDDFATSIGVDGFGNIYVTGYSVGSRTSYDFATIKYNPAGATQWVARYNGLGNYVDVANSIAVDGAGNVYVTGYSWGSGTDDDYATVKYNSAGVQQWIASYNGVDNGEDYATSIAVDGSGNVYVTGNGQGGGIHDDYATIKYNSAGVEQWIALYNGPGNDQDGATSIAVDGSGNISVTGHSTGSGTLWDYATIKYDSAGAEQWVARYNGLGNWYDGANSIVVDGFGDVYVTGYSTGSGNDYDYATIKYNSAGVEQWVALYNGPGDDADVAYSLGLDDAGNVYVTGRGSFSDYATVKYDSNGNQIWAVHYNGPGNYYDGASSLAVEGGGSVYVTGSSYANGTYADYATIKYSGGNIANWMPVEATVLGQPLPQEFALHQNYPNPFNASTAISYQLSANSFVSLRVYDTSGRLVEILVDGWRATGEHELTFEASSLPSGMYFARLEAGAYRGAQKMMLIK
jgi:hypothetical protein